MDLLDHLEELLAGEQAPARAWHDVSEKSAVWIWCHLPPPRNSACHLRINLGGRDAMFGQPEDYLGTCSCGTWKPALIHGRDGRDELIHAWCAHAWRDAGTTTPVVVDERSGRRVSKHTRCECGTTAYGPCGALNATTSHLPDGRWLTTSHCNCRALAWLEIYGTRSTA